MALSPMERAKKAYQDAKKKPGSNGHAGKAKGARTALPADEPRYAMGDAYEGEGRHGSTDSTPPESEEPWEPIMRLSEGAEAPAFPLEVFPAPLIRLCEEAAAAFPCPVDFMANPLLTLAGAAIGASRCVHIKSQWYEKANLYSTFIATPSSCKSPPMKLLSTPFYDRQQKCHDENKAAKIAWKADPEKDKKERPGSRSVFIQNTTTEKVAKLLMANPRGLIKLEDELSSWFSELNCYHSGGKGRDLEFWLAGNSGEPVLVQRADDEAEPIYVRHPFLSVCGPTTPAKLSEVFAIGEKSSGFIERILISFPRKLAERGEDWAEVSEESVFAWEHAVENLLFLEPNMDGTHPRPHIIRLSHSGRKAWERFRQKLADDMNHPDFPQSLAGFYGKHKGFCARIALILLYLRTPSERRDGEVVDGRAIDDAAKVISYYQGHLHKLLTLLGSDTDTERCQRIVAWIEKTGKRDFKKWEVFKGVESEGLFPSMAEVDRTLTKLVRHNYLRTGVVRREKGSGRQPGETYFVHPDL